MSPLLPDIVYVVRPGDRNTELRHSLRSLRNVPHRRVIIAGHVPSWIKGVVGVPTVQDRSKFENSTGNLKAALEHPDCGSSVLLMNDDFFVMRPIGEVPVMHRGTMDEVEAYYVNRGSGSYLTGLRSTRKLLRELGVRRPLSYELHIPFPIDRDRMLEAIGIGVEAGVTALHKRSLYGNLAAIGGGQMRDVKVLQRGWAFPQKGTFLSTMPESFRSGVVGDHIRQRFPEPSKYEGLLSYHH